MKGRIKKIIKSICGINEKKLFSVLENSNFDVISFDIFDTLIYRDVGLPEAIFDLIQKDAVYHGIKCVDFKTVRKKAEQIARSSSKGFEISLNDIYEKVHELTLLSDEDICRLQQMEIYEERKHCHASLELQRIFQSMIHKKKRVIITSDMYLEINMIRSLLKEAGYTGYDQLYVSSNEKVTKKSGGLFRTIIIKEGVSPDRILHIGDNPLGDFLMPKKLGIQAVLLK